MIKWKELTGVEQWKQIFEGTSDRPVVLLKHSTACPVSSNALNEFENYLGKQPNPDADYWMVKVIESRPASNQIAEDTGVRHASPQILYIKDKEMIWNASHWAITVEHITAVLD